MAYIQGTSTVKYNDYVKKAFKLKTEIADNLHAKACLRYENFTNRLAVVIFDKKTLHIIEYKENVYHLDSKEITDILFAMSPKLSRKIFRRTEFVKNPLKDLQGFEVNQINVYGGEIVK